MQRWSKFISLVVYVLIALAACSDTGTRGPSVCSLALSSDVSERESLSALSISPGTLSPAFSPTTPSYAARVVDSLSLVPFTVTAAAANPAARITINGQAVASGAPSAPIRISLSAPTPIDVAVIAPDGAEAHTTIVVTAVAEYTYIKASNTRAESFFGLRLALSGDTLAVSARAESSSATGINGNQDDASAPLAGAVYVFTRTAGVWSQQAYIKASNARTGSFFGGGVALSGDTLAVGAFGESSAASGVDGDQTDTSAPQAGAVYVFTRAAGVWSQQAYVKASNARRNALFGSGVAVSGNTLVVGAPGESSAATGVDGDQSDASAPDAGAVYVFARAGGAWSQRAYIKASNTRVAASFGASVALSGHVLAVGAPRETSAATGIDGDQSDASAFNAGAVYAFARVGGIWSQRAYIKASNTRANAGFGTSLALSGDTLAVGAPRETSAATGIDGDQSDTSVHNAGAVYVFTRFADTWSQQAYVKASNTQADATFGQSVALADDALAVGSRGESSDATGVDGDQTDTSASSSGAVYVFTRADGVWSQQAYVKPSHVPVGFPAALGESVSLSRDTLAAGGPLEASAATGINGDQGDGSARRSGAVYVIQ